MPLAFVPAVPCAQSSLVRPRAAKSSLLSPSSLRGRRLRASTPRRTALCHKACTAVKKEPAQDSGAADDDERTAEYETGSIGNEQKRQVEGVDDEEALDEAAMRAAEIHEVLTGLKDFKNRIILDATKLAKKVRAPKKQLEAALASHPDIIKIDGHIAELEEELKILGDR